MVLFSFLHPNNTNYTMERSVSLATTFKNYLINRSRVLYMIVLMLPVSLCGQVQKVNYFMKYNEATCLFDFCIIIKQGQATTMQQRVQMNAQYTVVVPTGSTVTMAAKYNPLQSNQNYTGTIPMDWQLGSTVFSPEAKPECDFYSIVPTLAPTSFYNNLYLNDTVRLFSLDISPVSDCGKGVRIFHNLDDPGPLAPGMNGSNFSNGFTIGGIQNRYDGNAASIFPRSPEITSLQGSCSQGLELHVEAVAGGTGCHGGVMYEWTGPEDFFSNEPNVSMPDAGPLQKGMYYIKVQDSLGCFRLDSVQAYVKPDAGKDVMVSCFSEDVATLKAKGTGLWTFSAGNPGQAFFTNDQNPLTTVYGFSDPGEYMAIWTSSGCSDTVWIDVRQNCQCQIQNTLEIPSVFSFCAGANEVMLTGNEVTDPGTYQWIYSVDGSANLLCPGNSTGKDYTTGSLNPGEYAFRRIFTRTTEPLCADTSNVIYIQVGNSLDAGSDIALFCFTSDTAFIQASGNGMWIIPGDNPAPLSISQFGNPVQRFENFSQSGTYRLFWTNDVCVDTLVITANAYCGCEVANGGEDQTACAGDTVQLTGLCAAGVWRPLASNPVGCSVVGDSEGTAIITFNQHAMGEYNFQFVVFDTLFDTVKVIVHTLPVISAGEDFGYCEDSPAVLLVAGGGISYTWSTGEITSNILVAPEVTTTYIVNGYDANGCAGSDSITVFIMPKPEGTIPSLPEVTQGSDVQLVSGDWTNAAQYIWNGPAGFTSVLQNPMLTGVTAQNAGLYTLTVLSEEECFATASVYLVVSQSPLPVQISSFTAMYNNERNHVDLDWKADFLVNHHYFVLERAENGKNYTEVEKINSEEGTQRYHVTDADISNGSAYWYRLVSYDLDGKQLIFGPVRVSTGKANDIIFHLYPVPATDHVKLHMESREEVRNFYIRIYNDQGVMVFESDDSSLSPNNLLEKFDISGINSGLYRLVIHTDSEIRILSMIKLD